MKSRWRRHWDRVRATSKLEEEISIPDEYPSWYNPVLDPDPIALRIMSSIDALSPRHRELIYEFGSQPVMGLMNMGIANVDILRKLLIERRERKQKTAGGYVEME